MEILFGDVIASESKSNNRRVNDHELYKCCQSLEINGVFKANFNFPEEDVELFNKYYNYAKVFKRFWKVTGITTNLLRGYQVANFM
jgi:hypothetical protein